jgi:hypothetical protein
MAAILQSAEHRSRRSLLESATLLVAWAVPVAIAAVVQYRELGTWSAYSATGEQSAFSLAYFREHLGTMLSSMTWRGVFVAFPAGLIGLVLLFRYHWQLAAVLLTWVLANLILYTSYYWAPLSDYNVYARFFLPSYPALLVCAMGLFVWPAARTRMLPVLAGVAVVVGVLCGTMTLLNNWVWANIEVIGRNNLEKRGVWVQQQVPPDAVFLCDEIDMLDHLQFASSLMLYDFRLFSAEELKSLVNDDRINSLAASRKQYLRDHFLSRGQEGLTALRNKMIADHKAAGHQVFVFSGPNDQWQSWDGLAQYGLQIKFLGEQRVPEPYLPVIATHWKLQEIVPINP